MSNVRSFNSSDVVLHINKYEFHHKSVKKYLYSSTSMSGIERLVCQAFLDRNLDKMDKYIEEMKEISSVEKYMDKKFLSNILTNYLISKLMLRVD